MSTGKKNSLSPDPGPGYVPTPFADYWRRWRFQSMHATAFLIVCIGAALAWRQMAQPLTFAGQAEVIQASVTTPEAGVLTNLWVTSFQQVKAGERIAELNATSSHANEQPRKPLQLVAPIAGTVTAIQHQPGEQLLPGQPVVTITSQESHRILGFVPPSFPVMPEVGTTVVVRSRSRSGRKGTAKVLGIGPQWESITNVLTFSFSTHMPPTQLMGRPVAISLPIGLHLTPGEPVEITLTK